MGIERNIEKKQRETGREVSQVSRLMEDLFGAPVVSVYT